MQCWVLQVSAAGYHAHLARRASNAQRQRLSDEALLVHIKALHGIRAKGKRRFKVTTDSHHPLSISPNLLNREFAVAEPDQVWVGDMTSSIVIDALRMAWFRRHPGKHAGLLFHAKDETIAWLLWYNRTRLHSTLAYVSPVQFEQTWLAAQPGQASS